MRLGGRASAAIEVLEQFNKSKRPASELLKDWGNANRFAGSGDRAAIGNLVYDCLRKKSSNGWLIDDDSEHGLVFSTLVKDWKQDVEYLAATLKDDKFAPPALNDQQIGSLASRNLVDAPEIVQADVQDWCAPMLEANFDGDWIKECQALAQRAPLDLRVNTLKSHPDKAVKALARLKPKRAKIAQNGLRLGSGFGDKRTPNIKSEAAYQKGWVEIQDQGSQIAAELVFARPGEQVLDFCAGAGGKTLAMAAVMENKGQIHAYDVDKTQQSGIFERIKRAGLRNVQVHTPDDDLGMLTESMDRVVVDAPCTGSGVWRRRPDSKWKLSKQNLEERLQQQEEVLAQAASFVKPTGFLVYITCSVFPEENENQVYTFMEENPQFELLSVGEVWEDLYGFDKPQPWSSDMKSVTLTPASTGTDGFFFAVMGRRKS